MSFIQSFFSGSRSFNITSSGNVVTTLPDLDPIEITDMQSVIINGAVVRGKNISMTNGVLYVDGKPHDSTAAHPATVLTIQLTGDVHGRLSTTSGNVTVTGDVRNNVNTASGDVRVEGSVLGQASTMSGDVTVQGDLGGDASTMSGDVRVNGQRTSKKRNK
jgi:DUF4097 and DUF4098 domain-containing protein YvlB